MRRNDHVQFQLPMIAGSLERRRSVLRLIVDQRVIAAALLLSAWVWTASDGSWQGIVLIASFLAGWSAAWSP